MHFEFPGYSHEKAGICGIKVVATYATDVVVGGQTRDLSDTADPPPVVTGMDKKGSLVVLVGAAIVHFPAQLVHVRYPIACISLPHWWLNVFASFDQSPLSVGAADAKWKPIARTIPITPPLLPVDEAERLFVRELVAVSSASHSVLLHWLFSAVANFAKSALFAGAADSNESQ